MDAFLSKVPVVRFRSGRRKSTQLPSSGGSIARVALLISILTAGLVVTANPASADATLMVCTEAALKSAVAQGGVVRYGVQCSTTPVPLTSPIAIPAGLNVDIVSDPGLPVVLDGRSLVRHFVVDGGDLTLVRKSW